MRAMSERSGRQVVQLSAYRRERARRAARSRGDAGLRFFGEILEVRRLDLGLRRADVAAAVGVHAETLRLWERGRLKRLPPPEKFNAVCAALRLGRLDVFNNCEYVRRFAQYSGRGAAR